MICFARDAYDEMVAYLKQHPGEIEISWGHPNGQKCGPLFALLCRKEHLFPSHGIDCGFGCLTQVAYYARVESDLAFRSANSLRAEVKELQDVVAKDDRLPTSIRQVVHDTSLLDLFAVYQRHADSLMDREPPVWK